MGRQTLNFVSLVDDYLHQNGWKARANSNSNYSLSELVLHTAGSVMANYALEKIYTPTIRKAHEDGVIHVHDLTHSLVGYCAGWSLQRLLADGFRGVPGQISTKPAFHFSTAVQHIIYYIKAMYQEWAGAQAFSSFDTLLAPYVYFDRLTEKEVRQELQRLVYSFNLPSKWGFEMPFSNLTFDWVISTDFANQEVVIGGKRTGAYYREFQREAEMINRAFLEVMLKGDERGRPFTFPIPTYNLTEDFFAHDGENQKLLFQVTAKYGLPYFQNYIGSGLKPSSVRAMCCRLNMNLDELMNQPGNLWAKGDSTGSVGVVTINLNRLALMSREKKDFFRHLDQYLQLAKEALEKKREVAAHSLKTGLMPYSHYYLPSFDHHFLTIGVCGGNEMCQNLLGVTLADQEGIDFTLEVLAKIKKTMVAFQQQTGHLYNLEATPAESTSYRFGLKDRKYFPQAKLAGTKTTPYVTNSTQLPVGKTDDVWEALEKQEPLQAAYTGGTVFHVFLGEEIGDWRTCRNLVKKIATQTKVPYFSITPTFSVCADCGRFSGEVPKCPMCGQETEVYSRVVGYLRPLSRWNKGKTQEFKDRKMFTIQSSPGEK